MWDRYMSDFYDLKGNMYIKMEAKQIVLGKRVEDTIHLAEIRMPQLDYRWEEIVIFKVTLK